MIFKKTLCLRDPVINVEGIAGVAFERSAFGATVPALLVSQIQCSPAAWLMVVGQEFRAAHEDSQVWKL